MKYLDLNFGYVVTEKTVTCFLKPDEHGNLVTLSDQAFEVLSDSGNGEYVADMISAIDEEFKKDPPRYSITCLAGDTFIENVGKSLARRHLLIKIFARVNDYLDDCIKYETSSLKKLIDFKKNLHNVRVNIRYKNARTLQRCEDEKKNG